MTRPTRDLWAMSLAIETAKRSTCLRRAVGCALLDAKGRLLASGYNGVARGVPHCNERGSAPVALYNEERKVWSAPPTEVAWPYACPGARSPSGTNLDGCQAIHAEQNALIQCSRPDDIDTCYATASPCITCVKMLMNTECRRIVFLEEYPHLEAARLWTEVAGRQWVQLI